MCVCFGQRRRPHIITRVPRARGNGFFYLTDFWNGRGLVLKLIAADNHIRTPSSVSCNNRWVWRQVLLGRSLHLASDLRHVHSKPQSFDDRCLMSQSRMDSRATVLPSRLSLPCSPGDLPLSFPSLEAQCDLPLLFLLWKPPPWTLNQDTSGHQRTRLHSILAITFDLCVD